MKTPGKLALYFRAARVLRSSNWRGLPVLPKRLAPCAPHSRAAYNSFVLWIAELELPAAAIVMDIGANHGDFAQAAVAHFPRAQIFVAEPLSHLQCHLEQISRNQPRPWRLLPYALGSERGHCTLHIDSQNDTVGSLVGFSDAYLKANPEIRPTARLECEVRTLDDVALENKIERVDLMKIDVEGFEMEVLKGAASLLAKTTALIVEVSLIRKSSVTNPLLAMLEHLAGHGFQIVNILPSLYDPVELWRPCEFNILARRTAN